MASTNFPAGLNGQATHNMGYVGGNVHGNMGPTICSTAQPARAARDPIQIPFPTPYGPNSTRHSAPTLSPPRAPEFRHGSASATAGVRDTSSRLRGRDRERDRRRDEEAQPSDGRGSFPMSEHDQQEYLENVENRFNTVENLLRNHAQLIAQQQKDIEELRNLLIVTSE